MKLHLKQLAFSAFLLAAGKIQAQPVQFNFPVELEVRTFKGLPELHSYCWAQKDGKWLIMSGRNNGLHGFQPPFAFPTANQNEMIYVVDPVNEQVFSASVSSLPTEIAEQVSATNLNFHQSGDTLVLIGGYGYSTSSGVYKTFPSLLIIDVAGLSQAIIDGADITPYFTHIADEEMAVTGAYLSRLNNIYYLVFGHRFDGRYNPMGGPSYTQTYTETVKRFRLVNNAGTAAIEYEPSWNDPTHFHRRDYNLAPSRNSDGTHSLMAFTGVFRSDLDLPHTTSVRVNANDYSVDSSFVQMLNQYHTALMPTWSANDQAMRTFFFGGIGQFYINENQELVEDSLVPFSKTISYIEQSVGATSEKYLEVEMPGFDGTSASFIPDLNAPFDEMNILNLDELPAGRIHVGTIYGGISSDTRNVFMQGTGSTWASSNLIDVYINTETLGKAITKSDSGVKMYAANGNIVLESKDIGNSATRVIITDMSGRLLFDESVIFQSGKAVITQPLVSQFPEIVFVRLAYNGKLHTGKIAR